jgi:hypothetical protein
LNFQLLFAFYFLSGSNVWLKGLAFEPIVSLWQINKNVGCILWTK